MNHYLAIQCFSADDFRHETETKRESTLWIPEEPEKTRQRGITIIKLSSYRYQGFIHHRIHLYNRRFSDLHHSS